MAELTLNIAVPSSDSAVFKNRKSAPKSAKKRIELRRRQKNIKWKQQKQGKQPTVKKVKKLNNAENPQSNTPKVSPIVNKSKSPAKRADVNKTPKKTPKTPEPVPVLSTNIKQHKDSTGKKSSVHTSIFGGNPELPDLGIKPEATEEELKNDKEPEINSSDSSSTVKITNFSDLNIHSALKSYIVEKMGITTMTEVQSRALSPLLSGEDVLIRSPTGTGKTLAYSLAVMENLQSITPEITRKSGVQAVILVPTRELAIQTHEVFQKLCLPIRRIVPTCVIGGQKRKSEKARIRKGVNIIVSTPGRFLDHLENTESMSLVSVKWMIFDEADRILDMGFQKTINKILNKVKDDAAQAQQTVLLSATLSPGVESLVNLSLNNPKRIEVNQEFGKNAVNSFVEPLTGLKVESVPLPEKLLQFVALIPSKQRLISLLAFIHQRCHDPTRKEKLVFFFSCRDSVEFHYNLLNQIFEKLGWKKVDIFELHGGMSQTERMATIAKFTRTTPSLLLCTDVAARGLDIPEVDWVVQYTSPGSPNDYIHRVGRTARAGKEGKALLFLTPAESEYAKVLTSFKIEVMEKKVDDIFCGLLDESGNKQQSNIRYQLAREKAAEVHKKLETAVEDNSKLKQLATKAYISFVRSYATYPTSLKHIFHIRNLHLGHVAKSFALQETPTSLVSSLQSNIGERNMKILKSNLAETDKQKRRDERKQAATGTKRKMNNNPVVAKFDLMSEFSSGVSFAKMKKTS